MWRACSFRNLLWPASQLFAATARAACQRNGHILKRNLYRSVSVAPGSLDIGSTVSFVCSMRRTFYITESGGVSWGPNFRRPICWRTVIIHEIVRCLRVICFAIYGHLSTRRTCVIPCVYSIRFRAVRVAIPPTCSNQLNKHVQTEHAIIGKHPEFIKIGNQLSYSSLNHSTNANKGEPN